MLHVTRVRLVEHIIVAHFRHRYRFLRLHEGRVGSDRSAEGIAPMASLWAWSSLRRALDGIIGCSLQLPSVQAAQGNYSHAIILDA